MSASPGLGYQKQSIPSSNYTQNDGSGSSYNYTHSHSPGTRTGFGSGTVHELNQSNPNFIPSSSSPSNFSSTKFSQESTTFPSSPSRALMTSNTEKGNNPNSGSPGLGGTFRPGIGNLSENSRDTTMMGNNSSNSIRTFPSGATTKSNNHQHDTDSKWTNSYVFNTGTTPGSLSSSVMDSLKPKWGPSRDELKDKLANSLSSDANVSILPGFSSNQSDGRRYFRTSASVPYLNCNGSSEPSDGPPERVPSAVTRAQNAIGRSRLEIGQAQSLIDMNKAKAQSLYRSPRGDAWTTMGTPGFGMDQFSVKRYKQESYRRDLEQQIQQKHLRVAEERRQKIEGIPHPFGVSYNSPVPSHYEPQKLSLFPGIQKPNLMEEYTKLDSRPSPRFQPKSVTNDVIGRSTTIQAHHLSQRRHFPQGGNSVTNPINHEQVNPAPAFRTPSPSPQQRPNVPIPQQIPAYPARGPVQPIPAYPEQPHPQYPYPYYPYGPAQQAYPYPVPPFTGYPQYPVQPQMAPSPVPHPTSYQQQPNHNAWPQNFKQQPRELVGRPGTCGPQMKSDTKPMEKPNSSENPNDNDDDINFDEDDCDIPMRMRIWQTSDQLPDPEFKKIAYKAQLQKQIIQKQKERTEQMAKEVEEDQRQEKRIQEYQALMKSEIEKEREELSRRCGNKERQRDLALQRAAEHYRMTQKMRSKKCRDKNDDVDIDNNGCGDVRQDPSSTSVSSSSDYETIVSTEVDSLVGHPVIVLPTTNKNAGGSSASLQGGPKKVTDTNHLSQIQKILATESKRLEQRLYCGDHSQISNNCRRHNKHNNFHYKSQQNFV